MPSALLAFRLRSRLGCQKQVVAGHRGRSAKKYSNERSVCYCILMKGTIISMACLATLAFAHSGVAADSLPDIKFTLSSTPSISIDGSTKQSFVNAWDSHYAGEGQVGLRKKLPAWRRGYQLFDLPGPGYRRLYQHAD